jgi:protein-L-isoaspartate(D-aspartate) O-methyltransferase
VERHPNLAGYAMRLLGDLGFTNIFVHLGDGSAGWPDQAPYDAIMVTAAAPMVPQPLLNQLSEQGRLVLPVGGQRGQTLERWRRDGRRFKRERLGAVAFVPLMGEFGWKLST